MSDLFRAHILEHSQNPRNFRALKKADWKLAAKNPQCGDDLNIYLIMDGQTIKVATFTGEGCALSVAGASVLTDWLKGRKISEVKKLTFAKFKRDLLKINPAPGRLKCASLAFNTVKNRFGD